MLRKLDLISSQSPWIDGAFSLILGKILNVNVVVQMHFEPKLVKNKLLKKYFMKLVIRLSSHVRLVSKSQLKFTRNLASKSQIIPVPCVLPNRATLQPLKTRKFDVIFFGRLHPEKGVSQFIQVLGSLEKLLSLRVLIVGEGPMKKDIAAYLKSRGSSGVVEFIPWTSRENLFNLIRESRLHLNLSPTESYGLSFIEAAACQTPSLATPTSGAKEIAKYIPSIQFLRSNDAPLIAQQIASLIQNDEQMSELHKLVPKFEFLERQFSDFTAWPIFLKSLIDTPKIISKDNHL
jgi:glycosyltransferase involved in cell wall biosynthesis